MINETPLYDGADGIKINDSKHVELYLLGVCPKTVLIAEDACRVCHYINFVNLDLRNLSLKTLIVFVYLDERDITNEEKWKKAYNHSFGDIEIQFIRHDEYLDRVEKGAENPNVILSIFDSRNGSEQFPIITEKERSISIMLSDVDSNKRPIEYYYSLSKHWCSRFRSAQPKGQVLDWDGFMNWITTNTVHWLALEHNRWMTEAIQRGYKPLTTEQCNTIDCLINSSSITPEEKKNKYKELKDTYKQINHHVDLCSFETLQQRDPDSIILDKIHNDKYLIQRIYEYYVK